jgi:hypothetical protein
MEMPQVDLDLPPPYSVLHLRLEAMPLLRRFVPLLYHLGSFASDAAAAAMLQAAVLLNRM